MQSSSCNAVYTLTVAHAGHPVNDMILSADLHGRQKSSSTLPVAAEATYKNGRGQRCRADE